MLMQTGQTGGTSLCGRGGLNEPVRQQPRQILAVRQRGFEQAVSPPHKFDWGAAALSFMGVDPNLFIGRRRAQDAEAQQSR
jgi:hypothetical protein